MHQQQQQQYPHQSHYPQQLQPYMLNPIQAVPQFPSTAPISTDYIQKCLDENKRLILAILDNQNLGKLAECAEYQALLQRNLLQLAAIADAQPQLSAARPQPVIPYGQQPAAFLPRASLQQLPEHPPQPSHQPQLFSIQSHSSAQPTLDNGMHMLCAEGTASTGASSMPSLASSLSNLADVQGIKPAGAVAPPESGSLDDGHKESGPQQESGEHESHEN